MDDPAVARSAERKAYRNVVLPLFIASVIAYLDRVNIGYAALTMNADLGFDARGFSYWMPTVLKDVSGWSNSEIGRAFAVAMLVSLVASVATGHSSSKRNEKRWHGAVGLINSVGNLGGFVGPYLTGWIKHTTGSFAGALLYLAASLTAAGLLILTLRNAPPEPRS